MKKINKNIIIVLIFILIGIFFISGVSHALRSPLVFSTRLAEKTGEITHAFKVVDVPRGKVDKEFLDGINTNKPKNILLYGGLGNLSEGFLGMGFKEIQQLFPNVRFIAVDTKEPGEEVTRRMKEIGLPWIANDDDLLNDAYLKIDLNNDSQFTLHKDSINKDGNIIINGKKIKVDGIITSVPTFLHLKLAELWADKGPVVWVDKPVAMIPELPRIREIGENHPDSMFYVDFFMDTDVMTWFMDQKDLLSKIGKVSLLQGRCVEDHGIEKGRDWLLRREISGGGLGIDMGLHPLVMMDIVLKMVDSKSTLNKVSIDEVLLGRYAAEDDKELPADVETGFFMQGHIGDIKIMVDSGKGLDTTYYGVEIRGEKGSIEICCGSKDIKPYIKVILKSEPGDKGEITFYRFKESGFDYRGIWLNYLLKIYGSNKKVGADFSQRLDATVESEALIGRAYEYHNLNTGEIGTYKIGVGMQRSIPLAVTQETVSIIFELDRQLDKRGNQTDVAL